MKQPKGIDILALLIDLYAEQEGVTIKYELEERKYIHEAANQ